MDLANFYDTVGKLGAPSPDAVDVARRVELADAIIGDLLDAYIRLEGYEKKYGPTFEDQAEDGYAVEVLRSIRQMFEAWLTDARPVYESVSNLPRASQVLPRLLDLRKAIGFARVRRVGTPEDELAGVQQLRRGEGIRYSTVGELRNELRAEPRS